MATQRRHREPTSMVGIQARIPAAFGAWLSDQASENGSTVSAEIRNAIAAAIVRAGNAERYGIDVDELEVGP